MRLLTILIILIITGCGSEYEPLVEWSGNEVERSERFILNYDTDKFPESQLPKVEQWWIDVQECVGVSVEIEEPLIIEYTENSELPVDGFGRAEYKSRYSRINLFDITHLGGITTKHELIHHIIFMIEGVTPDNNHDHLFFQMCG